MLPEEQANKDHVQKLYGHLFARGREGLTAGVELIEALVKANYPHRRTKATIAAILADQIVRYRAMVAVCELGDSSNADILGRTIYEGVLAERFILKRRYKAANTRKLPKLPSGVVASDFRALLYGAAPKLKFCRTIETTAKSRGLKRFSKARLALAATIRDEVKKEIGTTWYGILNNQPNTYSGLSVQDLAKCCAMGQQHGAIYPMQSGNAHANWAIDRLRVSGSQHQIQLHGDHERLPAVMSSNLRLFVMMLRDINRVFKLGANNRLQAIWVNID